MRMTERGRFIVLDGIDGCGKSTQASRLTQRLRAMGRRVLHVRDPGATPVGEGIRRLLLDPATGEMEPMAEMLLYQAARAQLARAVIAPALIAGEDVVCERWHSSTEAYQGAAGGVDGAAVRTCSALATGGCEPDRAVLLDLPVADAAARLTGEPDRIEARGPHYRALVAAAFRAIQEGDPKRWRRVAADRAIDQVEEALWRAVEDLFAPARQKDPSA